MDKKLDFEDFLKMKVIKKIPETERKSYLSFHEKIWKEDCNTSKFLIKRSPRWAVIAGYYAMHNLAKYFLAKKFNLKISGKFVHAATIEALRKFLKEEDIVHRLEKAKKFLPLEELPEFLELGRRERAKSQYYIGRPIRISIKEAKWFFSEIVEPFIKSMVKLL